MTLGQSTIKAVASLAIIRRNLTDPNVQAKGFPGPQPVNPYPFNAVGRWTKRVCFEHRRGKGLPSVFHRLVSVSIVCVVLVEADANCILPHIGVHR
ncbi:unnamed protein product [Arctogadus glacialis]